MEYTTTTDGELATVTVTPVDWAALYAEKARLTSGRVLYNDSIDEQIAKIDAIFSEATERGVVIPIEITE